MKAYESIMKAYKNIQMSITLPSSFILITLLNAIIAPKSVLLKCDSLESFKARNNKKAKKQRKKKKQRTSYIKEAGSLESVFSLFISLVFKVKCSNIFGCDYSTVFVSLRMSN